MPRRAQADALGQRRHYGHAEALQQVRPAQQIQHRRSGLRAALHLLELELVDQAMAGRHTS
jgi:hypothetical protein